MVELDARTYTHTQTRTYACIQDNYCIPCLYMHEAKLVHREEKHIYVKWFHLPEKPEIRIIENMTVCSNDTKLNSAFLYHIK